MPMNGKEVVEKDVKRLLVQPKSQQASWSCIFKSTG